MKYQRSNPPCVGRTPIFELFSLNPRICVQLAACVLGCKLYIGWGVAKCVHEIGRNQKIKSPHFRFKWCFLCSGGLNMMILDQIIQKKTIKTTTKQPKTSTHSCWFLWTGQGTFLVEDFHRPNGAKILRFGNFPHPLTCLGGVENCQKSKSFSKIWLWKSSIFGYFLDRTRIY